MSYTDVLVHSTQEVHRVLLRGVLSLEKELQRDLLLCYSSLLLFLQRLQCLLAGTVNHTCHHVMLASCCCVVRQLYRLPSSTPAVGRCQAVTFLPGKIFISVKFRRAATRTPQNGLEPDFCQGMQAPSMRRYCAETVLQSTAADICEVLCI